MLTGLSYIDLKCTNSLPQCCIYSFTPKWPKTNHCRFFFLIMIWIAFFFVYGPVVFYDRMLTLKLSWPWNHKVLPVNWLFWDFEVQSFHTLDSEFTCSKILFYWLKIKGTTQILYMTSKLFFQSCHFWENQVGEWLWREELLSFFSNNRGINA